MKPTLAEYAAGSYPWWEDLRARMDESYCACTDLTSRHRGLDRIWRCAACNFRVSRNGSQKV